MPRLRGLVLVGLGAAALSACGSAGAVKSEPPPSHVVRAPGSNARRVVLTAHAVQRLGLETAKVTAAAAGATTVPYSALIYTPNGQTLVYEQVGTRAYQRAPVIVDRIDGDRAVLSTGPTVGTPVVSVATAEVYGTEFFSDHE